MLYIYRNTTDMPSYLIFALLLSCLCKIGMLSTCPMTLQAKIILFFFFSVDGENICGVNIVFNQSLTTFMENMSLLFYIYSSNVAQYYK